MCKCMHLYSPYPASHHPATWNTERYLANKLQSSVGLDQASYGRGSILCNIVYSEVHSLRIHACPDRRARQIAMYVVCLSNSFACFTGGVREAGVPSSTTFPGAVAPHAAGLGLHKPALHRSRASTVYLCTVAVDMEPIPTAGGLPQGGEGKITAQCTFHRQWWQSLEASPHR